MVNREQLENRLLPYKLLLEATTTMVELADQILSDTAIPSLIFGLRGLEATLLDYLEKAGDGWPIVGHHFSLPSEFLHAFECIPVCIEVISIPYAA